MIRISILAVALCVAGAPTLADTLQYATENGAIDGYDPVAYFDDGQPERGSPDITATWNGAEWHFTIIEHRDAFVASPEKYAPQYGGYRAPCRAHSSPRIAVHISPGWRRMHRGAR